MPDETKKKVTLGPSKSKEPFSAPSFFMGLGIGVIIGAIVVVILIYLGARPTKISVFGIEFELPNRSVSTAASVSTAIPTLKPEINPVVKAVDNFFSAINNAKNEYDYQDAFGYLTSDFQIRNGGFNNFYKTWSQVTVNYKLYECPQVQPLVHIVDTELFYFNRNSPYQAYGSDQIRYYVVDVNSESKLDSGEEDTPPGANCSLTIDRTIP